MGHSLCTKKLLAFFIFISCITTRVLGVTFTITNACSYTIWPGILSNAGVPLLANGGFVLSSGQSKSMRVPEGWSGRLWGRTGCNFSTSGQGICTTGRCDDKLECQGTGGEPPATLVEFTIHGNSSNFDFYDVSMVDGYNLPVTVTPKRGSNGTCTAAGCAKDMKDECPKELRVMSSDGEDHVTSCKSACLAFGAPAYCCSGVYSNPTTCKPSKYSKAFKAACPKAYSYAFDDPTSLFTCLAPLYAITFCPSSSSSSPPSPSSPSSSPPFLEPPPPMSVGNYTQPPLNTQVWNPIPDWNGASDMVPRWVATKWVIGELMVSTLMAFQWIM